jgi:hypothetical protein
MAPLPLKIPSKRKKMLEFGVSAAAKSKEIRVLILWGTYDIDDILIREIIFHNDLYNFELAFQRH